MEERIEERTEEGTQETEECLEFTEEGCGKEERCEEDSESLGSQEHAGFHDRQKKEALWAEISAEL